MDQPARSQSAAPAPSPERASASSKRVLEPMERASEVLFGLIMALTFTGSISAAEGKREEIRILLVGAVACNIAWGVVDGAMYLMACLVERGTAWRAARAFREARRPEDARDVIVTVLPRAVAAALPHADLESMRVSLSKALVDPPRPRLTLEDLRGALGVFLLVTLSTLPIVIPFVLMSDAMRALRVSNAIAIVMLFAAGWVFGKAAGLRPWAAGGAMVGVGALLVAITIALGG